MKQPKQPTKTQFTAIMLSMIIFIGFLMWRNFERNTQPKKAVKITTYQADSLYTSTIVGNRWGLTEDTTLINE